MELTGKVIIFDNEEDAKIWFDSIKETNHKIKIENLKLIYEEAIKNLNNTIKSEWNHLQSRNTFIEPLSGRIR